MRKCFILITFVYSLFACEPVVKYTVNNKTTEVGYLDVDSVSSFVQDSIRKKYSLPVELDTTKWKEKYDEIKKMPFKTDVLFFKDPPMELVGVNFNYKCIRYIYNPKLSYEILIGISPELDSLNKERIMKRVEKLIK